LFWHREATCAGHLQTQNSYSTLAFSMNGSDGAYSSMSGRKVVACVHKLLVHDVAT
jgi:hypothetical protein